MRGSPLWQVLFVVAAFVVAGWPVYRLTRPASAEASAVANTPTVSPTPASTQSMLLELEAVFAPPPADFEVKYLDQTVAAGQGPQTRFTAHWTVAMPPEGADLVVRARWPVHEGADASATSPVALRLTARFPDGRQAEKTFWSGADSTVTDVWTVPGQGSVAP